MTGPHVALGDRDIAGHPRLRRQQVVAALVETLLVDLVADRQQTATLVEQEAEVHAEDLVPHPALEKGEPFVASGDPVQLTAVRRAAGPPVRPAWPPPTRCSRRSRHAVAWRWLAPPPPESARRAPRRGSPTPPSGSRRAIGRAPRGAPRPEGSARRDCRVAAPARRGSRPLGCRARPVCRSTPGKRWRRRGGGSPDCRCRRWRCTAVSTAPASWCRTS